MMGIQEPRIIDEIHGLYDGRKVTQIDRENGKIDFKVRKQATKRRHLVSLRTVKTDYWLDPEKDVIEVEETKTGEKRIYLVPVSDDLQVHQEKTVHQRKMRALETSFDRETQRRQELERENRTLKRRLARLADGDEADDEQSSSPQQRYECQNCENTMTEKQATSNKFRCSNCNQDKLEVMNE